MELQLAKGMRDFSPEEKLLRNGVVSKLTELFELYGYNPLETPIVERYDVLSAKFAAGEESDSLKETFKLNDQGKRDLGLRFDLTVPFARYIAMNPEIKMPFKRYQIGEVFRDGPIKLGRYREFWQCDVDVVGTKSMIAEAEQIKLALDFFARASLDAYIEVNNRKLLQSLLLDCGVNESKLLDVIIIVDKIKKLSENELKVELNKLVDKKTTDKIIATFEITSLKELEKLVKDDIGKQGIQELNEFFSYFSKEELKNVKLNTTLARGFGYYTGTVFEGFLRKSQITSSICGGGRYDNMIGKYVGKNTEYPAVGISFGLDVISEAIKLNKIKTKKTKTKIYVIPINTTQKSLEIVAELRKANISTDLDIIGRGITKNLDYANKLEIPYVLFIGEKELKLNKFKLKDMVSGKEELLTLNQLIKKLS
nr:histidine--tRNA ligase [Nanoarchaeum sp.]